MHYAHIVVTDLKAVLRGEMLCIAPVIENTGVHARIQLIIVLKLSLIHI